MHPFTRLVPTAAVLLMACSTETEPPAVVPSPFNAMAALTHSGAPLKPPSKESLCPKDNIFEEGHPQSRWFRGGCLEYFQHFVTADGRLPPEEIAGAVTGMHYELGNRQLLVKPAGKEKTPSGEEVSLYEVFIETAGGPINPCAEGFRRQGGAGAPHDERAIAVPGAWGVHSAEYFKTSKDGSSVFTLACRSGAVAKAVTWGYAPWASYEGTPLGPYFFGALAMIRAQYNWSASTAYTDVGTYIYVVDRLGLQKAEPGALAGLTLEAEWGARGLSCMGKPRYPACDGESAVKDAEKCTHSADASSSDPARWDKDVLFVTYSRRDGETGSRKCPNQSAPLPTRQGELR